MSRIIVAYVPVVHAGYISFFKKHSAPLFVFGGDIIKSFPRIDRDLRAVSAQDACKMVQSLNVCPSVCVLDLENLSSVKQHTGQIVFPDDELSRAIAHEHFIGANVMFDTVFLRWDKIAALSKFPVAPDQIISQEIFDRIFMTSAFNHASLSSDWWRRVGAVVMKDNVALLVAYNRHYPSEQSPGIVGDPRANFDAGISIDISSALHAEKMLIACAAKDGINLSNASIYVTTFPCHDCALMIIEAGIKKVYYTEGYSQLDAEGTLKSRGVELVRVQM
ncbi:deoxycytidylate deaminase [bacterium]|mgnify:CR=1 FL=1|nr:deoxycytidylate deaminase [bacterium]|tara:strand:+ start:2073 stop:2903 length:831 start_codon:yes stop_codon:yes gene_type:complete